jgi:hypothetical protein
LAMLPREKTMQSFASEIWVEEEMAHHNTVQYRVRILNVLGAQESIPRNRLRQPMYVAWRAGTTNRIIVSARYKKLAESIPWSRFLSSWNVYKFGLSSYHWHPVILLNCNVETA